MTTEIITVDDLPQSVVDSVDPDLLQAMVAGANARAARVAPCLVSQDPPPTEDQLAEAQLVLIGAVTRWSQSGSGAFTQQTAGPFSATVDTRQRGGYNLWPSEIEELEAICGGAGSGAYMIDMTGDDNDHPNPLTGVTINAHPGHEPMGQWADQAPPPRTDVAP